MKKYSPIYKKNNTGYSQTKVLDWTSSKSKIFGQINFIFVFFLVWLIEISHKCTFKWFLFKLKTEKKLILSKLETKHLYSSDQITKLNVFEF